MSNEKFYPLGSVVLLEGAIKKMLIIGRGLVVNRNDKEMFFDYAGVIYPEGLVSEDVAYFNNDMIAKVVYEGYSDDDDKIVVNNINKFIESHPDMIKGSAEAWG